MSSGRSEVDSISTGIQRNAACALARCRKACPSITGMFRSSTINWGARRLSVLASVQQKVEGLLTVLDMVEFGGR